MSGIEILGIAASVVQIADAGARLSSKLFVFTRKVKNADRSISDISQEIAATGAALRELGEALEDDKYASLGSKQSVDTTSQIVADCWKVFTDINDTIGGDQLIRQREQHDEKSTAALTKFKQPSFTFKQRLRFPYVESQVILLKSKLEGLKSSLMLMLQVLLLAEQVRNRPKLAVSDEQKALLQTLVDERNAKEAEFRSSCMAIEKATIVPSDLESFNTNDLTSADTSTTNEQDVEEVSTRRAISTLCEPGNAFSVFSIQSVPDQLFEQPLAQTETTGTIPESSASSSSSASKATPSTSTSRADSSSSRNATLPRSLQTRQRDIEHHAQLVQNLLEEIGNIQHRIDHGIRHRMHDGVLKLHWNEWSPHALKHGHEHFHRTFNEYEDIARYWIDQDEEAVTSHASTPAGRSKVTFKEAVHFKDAIGRRYNFPVDECQSWYSMNELITQAFTHVEGIGDDVSQGRFDLFAVDGTHILPSLWNSMVRPAMEVTMMLWPYTELCQDCGGYQPYYPHQMSPIMSQYPQHYAPNWYPYQQQHMYPVQQRPHCYAQSPRPPSQYRQHHGATVQPNEHVQPQTSPRLVQTTSAQQPSPSFASTTSISVTNEGLSSPQRSNIQTPGSTTSSSKSNVNVRASEFRPSATAPAFDPTGAFNTASSPSSTQRAASVSRAASPSAFAGAQVGTDPIPRSRKLTNLPEPQADTDVPKPDSEISLDEEQVRVCQDLFTDFDHGSRGCISENVLEGALETFLADSGYSDTLEVDTEGILELERGRKELSSEGIGIDLFKRCAARSLQVQKAYEESTVLLRIFDKDSEEINDGDELKEVIRSLGGAISDEEYDIFIRNHAKHGTRQLSYADCLALLRHAKLLIASEAEDITRSFVEDRDEQKPLAVVKLHRRTYQQHMKAVQEHEQWRNLRRPLIGIEDHEPGAFRLEDALGAGTVRHSETDAHIEAGWPRWAFAMWRYRGTAEADLSFGRGDFIEILSEGDGTWWVGRLGADPGKSGFVPSNYLSYMPIDFVPGSFTCSDRHSSSVASEKVDETPTNIQNYLRVSSFHERMNEGLDHELEKDKQKAKGEHVGTMRVPDIFATSSNTPYVEEERECPLYVNNRQFHRILKRRVARRKLEEKSKDISLPIQLPTHSSSDARSEAPTEKNARCEETEEEGAPEGYEEDMREEEEYDVVEEANDSHEDVEQELESGDAQRERISFADEWEQEEDISEEAGEECQAEVAEAEVEEVDEADVAMGFDNLERAQNCNTTIPDDWSAKSVADIELGLTAIELRILRQQRQVLADLFKKLTNLEEDELVRVVG